MSGCDQCVHTYISGNCLLDCDQTFITIENRVVNSSLEPDCPHFILSDRVRDSSDSAKDLGDSAKDLNDNIFSDSYITGKLSTKFDILRGVNYGLFGAGTISVLFFVLNELPSLDLITLIFCVVFLISAVIYAYDSPVDNDQDRDGDDQ